MINNLQVLRALAALNIVLYHSFGISQSYGYGTKSPAFNPLREWSANGVDVFFVISGFVMYYTQHGNPKSSWGFMTSRIKRIVPLYWSVTLGCLALMIFLPTVFRQATFDPVYAVSSLLFVSHLFDYKFPVLAPGWTLELEMLFYLLFALSINIRRINPIFTVSALLGLAVLVLGVPPIVWEFVMGLCAGWCFVHGHLKKAGPWLFALGMVGLAASATVDAEANRIVLWGGPSFLLVLGCCYIRQIKAGLWVMLGSASYGIYLIHTMTLPVFYKVLTFMDIQPHGLVPDANQIMCVAFSAAVGLLIYRYYERPLARLL